MVTAKSWLGKVVGQQFREMWKRLWNKAERENDGGFNGKVMRGLIGFPFEWLEGVFIDIYNRFYWATADLVQQIGCNIGDSAMGKVNETLDKANAYVQSKVAETQKYIENELITPLQKKANTLTSQMNEAQAKLNDMGRFLEQAKTRLSNVETDMTQLQQSMADKAKALDAQMNAAQAKLNDFNRVIEQAQKRLNDVETKVNQATDKANTLTSQMNAAQAKLNKLNTLIDEAKATLQDHESRLQQLEEKPAQAMKFPEIFKGV